MTRTATPWFQGSRALVVGLARSGIAAAKLLLRHGSDVRGVDRRRPEELEGTVRELRDLGVETAEDASAEPAEAAAGNLIQGNEIDFISQLIESL